jgi:hypothetical protein
VDELVVKSGWVESTSGILPRHLGFFILVKLDCGDRLSKSIKLEIVVVVCSAAHVERLITTLPSSMTLQFLQTAI